MGPNFLPQFSNCPAEVMYLPLKICFRGLANLAALFRSVTGFGVTRFDGALVFELRFFVVVVRDGILMSCDWVD